MKKSLYTALGLAVALAVSAPVLGSVANAAPAATSPASTTPVKKVAHKHQMTKTHKTAAKKDVKKPATAE